MSSEMRVTDAMARAAMDAYYAAFRFGKHDGVYYSEDERTEAMRSAIAAALLARTEAGADGAVAEVVRTAPERIWLQVADDTYYAAEPFPHPASDQITWCQDSVMAVEVPYVRADLATHPQDASGDAERYRWLRDEASRAQLEMFADRRGTRLAADRVCAAGIDIAMQAKEAK